MMLSCSVTFAQVNVDSRPNQIFITPLRIVDPVNPGFELGYQRSYHHNLATLIAIARMFSTLTPELDFTNYKGWRLDLEQKYFLPSRRSTFRMYVAVNVNYLKADYKTDEGFKADTNANTPSYIDNVDVHKTFIAETSSMEYNGLLIISFLTFMQVLVAS